MSDKKTMINDLSTGSLFRQIILFSIPFMLSNMLQSLYSIVDMIVIGRFVGSVGLSAVSNGAQMIMFFTFMGMGFASAGQILIAQYVGSQDRGGIYRTVGTVFSLLAIAGLVFGAVGLIFAEPLLRLLNVPEEAMSDSVAYLRICAAGLIFTYGYNAVSAILRGMGESRRPLLFVAIAALTNLILDLVFVALFHMGPAGAALATILGQILSFVISIIYLVRRKEQFVFDFKLSGFRIDPTTARRLLALGAPMAIQSAAISISCMVTNAFVNSYGVAASAVTGVGAKLMDVICIVSWGLSGAGSTIVAQNMGAGKPDRVKKFVHISLALCLGTVGACCIVCLLMPRQIVGIFSQDADVLALAPEYIKIMVVGLIASAIMPSYCAVINGIGFASLSLAIGLTDGVVARIGLSLLLGIVLDLGLDGFWLGTALAGYVTAIGSMIYFYSGHWQKRKLITQQ